MMKNFFSSNGDSRLNEIIFENRNKEYGAYALRREENSVLTKSLFLGVSFVFALAVTPLFFNPSKTEAIPQSPPSIPFVIQDLVNETEIPEQNQSATAPQKVETFVSTTPTPTSKVEKETPAPTAEQYQDATPGFEKSEGEKPATIYTPAVVQPGPVTVPAPEPVKPVEKPAEDPEAVLSKVDVKADFAGGLERFRAKVGENMDVSQFAGSGERITANVTFIVEKDGSITNIKANGKDHYFNREAERAVKSVRGKWTAAKVKGNAVRSYFNVPVTVQFE